MKLRPSYALLTATALLAAPSTLSAQDVKQACVAAHEDAQVSRKQGALRQARDRLRTCARDECPALVRTDCVDWAEQVDRAFPSVVVQAQNNGVDVDNVRVSVDTALIATRLDGKPIELDPGEHTLRFELVGAPSVEQKIVVRQGEKDRPIMVKFGDARGSAEGGPDAKLAPRAVPVATILLGAVGVAGLAGFATFAALGHADENSLSTSCAPRCSPDQVHPMHEKYFVADVSLGVGAASLIGALGWYLVRPGGGPAPGASVGVAPTAGGARVQWGVSF